MLPRTKRLKRLGRWILALFYLAYCIFYFSMLSVTPESAAGKLLDSTILTMLWTTALFIAMWFGQNWARYIYMFLLLLAVLFSIPMLFSIEASQVQSWRMLALIVPLMAFNIGVLLTLAYSPAIQALVKN